MHHRLVLRAVTGVALAAALALPGAAYAQTLRHSDPAKDVQKLDGSNQVSNAPRNKTADVVHVKVTHGKKQVQTTLKLRDLRGTWVYISVIKTAAKTYQVTAYRKAGNTTFSITKPNGSTVSCDGQADRSSTGKDTVTMKVPDSCIGTPHWVKVGVGFVVPTKSNAFYADDALRKRGAQESNLTLSKRLHRG